jgi:hypothetical protein
MQMHQVQYFLALCEELNFTRAGRRCGVSQPSLTIAIRALERELGGALFERKHCDRVDGARPHGKALSGRNRAQRGSRLRGCTQIDAATGWRPTRPSSRGRCRASIDLIPPALGNSLHRLTPLAQQHPGARRCGSLTAPNSKRRACEAARVH